MIYDLVLNNAQKIASPGWQERLRDHGEAYRLLLDTLSALAGWIPGWLFWPVLGGGVAFFTYAWFMQMGYKICLQFQVRWLEELPPSFQNWAQPHHQHFLEAGFLSLGDALLEGLNPQLENYCRLYVHPDHPEVLGSATAVLKLGSPRLFQKIVSVSSYDANGHFLSVTSLAHKYSDLFPGKFYSAPTANPAQLFQIWQQYRVPVPPPVRPVERESYPDRERKALQQALDRWVERGLAWYQPDDQEYLLTARGARYMLLKQLVPARLFQARATYELGTSKGAADWVSQL